MNIIQIIWILILIFALFTLFSNNSASIMPGLKTLRLIQKRRSSQVCKPYTPARIFKFSGHTPYSLY